MRHPERYPPDWAAISARIRLERAGGRCECDGRCRSPHCAAYYAADTETPTANRCLARNRLPHPSTGSRVILTVAHLDRDAAAGNHHDDNLLALCQACHFAYDRPTPQNPPHRPHRLLT